MTGQSRRGTRAIAVLVAAATLVGCAGGASPTASEPSASLTAEAMTPSVARSAPVGSFAASPSVVPDGVELTEESRGQTVAVRVGTMITVVLHSTYWSPSSTSAAAIVAPVAAPRVSPASPGTCLPGVGCGTVTSTFVARAPGDARLTADRTVCGEALNCKDADKSWMVDIRVTS